MIDWEKPIETVDGVAAELRWPEKLTNKSIVVEVVIDGDNEISRSYNRNGTHYAGASPRLRNVVETGPITAPMEFGLEVRVDGVKPEWLDPNVTPVLDVQVNRISTDADEFPDNWCWEHIKAIKLPANHPYYTTPTPDERAVAPELVERMRKFVSKIAVGDWVPGTAFETEQEARAIVAVLEPVDEDLVEARRIACDNVPSWDENNENCVSGRYDSTLFVVIAKAALARGRQLEKEGK